MSTGIEFAARIVEPIPGFPSVLVTDGEGIMNGVSEQYLGVTERLPQFCGDAGVPPVEQQGPDEVSVARVEVRRDTRGSEVSFNHCR